jgi:hypothetical protein
MIRDLMPLCAEHMASEASEQIVQAHLAECRACAAEWQDIRTDAIPAPEVPEETKQFAKAAKRVKKKHARLLVIAVLTTVIVLLGVMSVNTFVVAGGRFTPEQAARTGLKKNRIDRSYDAVYTFLPSYSTESICLMQYTDPDSGAENIMTVFTFRAGICWFLGGILGDTPIPSEQGVYALTHPLNFAYYDTYYYYVNDPAVQEVTLICGEQTVSMTPDQYPDKICQFYLKHSFRKTQGTVTGMAADADGNVLYTLQDNTWIPAEQAE